MVAFPFFTCPSAHLLGTLIIMSVARGTPPATDAAPLGGAEGPRGRSPEARPLSLHGRLIGTQHVGNDAGFRIQMTTAFTAAAFPLCILLCFPI